MTSSCTSPTTRMADKSTWIAVITTRNEGTLLKTTPVLGHPTGRATRPYKQWETTGLWPSTWEMASHSGRPQAQGTSGLRHQH
eukprot:6424610-Heterocapsa_arctica.AAC.1